MASGGQAQPRPTPHAPARQGDPQAQSQAQGHPHAKPGCQYFLEATGPPQYSRRQRPGTLHPCLLPSSHEHPGCVVSPTQDTGKPRAAEGPCICQPACGQADEGTARPACGHQTPPTCPRGLPESALETHGLPQPSRLERTKREGRRTPGGQQGLLSPRWDKSTGVSQETVSAGEQTPWGPLCILSIWSLALKTSKPTKKNNNLICA